MRTLWPIERAVVEAAAHDYEASANSLREQVATAEVTEFENTGAGFFSTVRVSPDASRLTDKSPGSVDDLQHGMGFLALLENGHVSLIEGCTYGDVSTLDIDFASVDFTLKPWSLAGE